MDTIEKTGRELPSRYRIRLDCAFPMRNGREVPRFGYFFISVTFVFPLSGRTLRELVHTGGRHSGGPLGVLGASWLPFFWAVE